jgi:hexosaminidase
MLDAVILGDSLTRGANWQDLLGRSDIGNHGIPGDTIVRVLERLDVTFAAKPTTLAIMVGINDLLAGASVQACAARYAALVGACKGPRSSVGRIVVQTLLPVGTQVSASNNSIREFNDELRAICSAERCRLVNLFDRFTGTDGALRDELTTDGLHLTARGYALWADALRRVL